MKINSKHLLKEAESLGLVADSMQVRMSLIEDFEKGNISLQNMQGKLKKIQKEAKKNCLTVRKDYYLNQLLDLDIIHKRWIYYNFQKLNNNLTEKPSEKKKTKIKI